MSITINIYYTGKNGNARRFAEKMFADGIVDCIRNEDGNERYDYFFSAEDPETLLLIDSWRDQHSLDVHHSLPLMSQIAHLREEFDLHMKVERYLTDDNSVLADDEKFIRK